MVMGKDFRTARFMEHVEIVVKYTIRTFMLELVLTAFVSKRTTPHGLFITTSFNSLKPISPTPSCNATKPKALLIPFQRTTFVYFKQKNDQGVNGCVCVCCRHIDIWRSSSSSTRNHVHTPSLLPFFPHQAHLQVVPAPKPGRECKTSKRGREGCCV